MKQIDFEKEIFLLLKKERLHQREFARLLKTNQTSIRRFLMQLEKRNIIDLKEKGKNKEYFIKDSIESLIFERLTEYYKIQKIIINKKIRRIFSEINKKILSKKIPFDTTIVLFGSYSKGLESNLSDIDIYIDNKSEKIKKEIEEISTKISVKQGNLTKDNFLSKEIIQNHIILNNVEGFLNKIR